jgi:hypothetical protein
VKSLSLQVVYVTLHPEQYPRVKKMATTLEGKDIKFQALTPRIRIKLGKEKLKAKLAPYLSST